MVNNGNNKKTKSTNDRDLILQSSRSCGNVDIYQGNWMCNESWLQLINLTITTHSKDIPNLIQNNFNAAIGTVMGLFDASNDGGIYRKQLECKCPYNGLRRVCGPFVSAPKVENHLQIPVNHLVLKMPMQRVFLCYRVERLIPGRVMMTITPPK